MSRAHKDDERRWVECFLAAWSDRTEIQSIDASESPDFVGVLKSGKPFGLEVATLTDDKLAESTFLIDAFKTELIQAARAASINALFSLDFEEYEAPALRATERRRRLIGDLIELAREAEGRTLRREVAGIDSVTIHPAEDGPHAIIGRSARGRGWNFIQGCIKAKNAKADGYRSTLPPGAELWLLLVAGSSFANGVEVPPKHLPFDASFDRIFFLDHWPVRSGKDSDRVVELKIAVPIQLGLSGP
jgi:hypothetical protein